nr:MAG TPA: hypothetical protein [Bacteriophage sp.]
MFHYEIYYNFIRIACYFLSLYLILKFIFTMIFV